MLELPGLFVDQIAGTFDKHAFHCHSYEKPKGNSCLQNLPKLLLP
jgi:hypothetical protein